MYYFVRKPEHRYTHHHTQHTSYTHYRTHTYTHKLKMDPPTDTNNVTTTRRTTFADENNDNTATADPSIKIEAPTKLADAFIRRHLASLPPNYFKILELASKNHVKLLIKIYKKTNIIKRMESTDYIPKSARIKFDLKTSKKSLIVNQLILFVLILDRSFLIFNHA